MWLVHRQRRWWTLAVGNQPLLWHSGHWWWKTRDGWFLLHDGEAWAYHRFETLEADGLVHPASGASVIYSRDLKRAEVRTAEGKKFVFDLATGEEAGTAT